MKLDSSENLPDFEMGSEPPPAPPKRERRKPQRAGLKVIPKKKVSAVARGATGPKRARKKRVPRRVPGRAVVTTVGAPPNVAPEAAGVIRAYMNLDETQRAVVIAFLQALR